MAAESALTFESFLLDVHPALVEYVTALHDRMVAEGYAASFKPAARSCVVSFKRKGENRVLANFVMRKNGPLLRLYADNVGQYADAVESINDAMAAAVAKAPLCKRLHDPAACSSRCPMGYQFTLRGEAHKKCRYNCFLLPVNEQNAPHLSALLESEMRARSSAS